MLVLSRQRAEKGESRMNKSISISTWRFRSMSAFVLALLLWGVMRTAFAKENKVDINALVQETQKIKQISDEMTLIWWIPDEYWRASFEQDPNITAAQTEEFIKILHPYMVIVAVDGNIGTLGGVTYKPETSIRNSIQITDSQGTHYRPLSDEKINADTKNFLSMMKPVFANMLGPMGQNMHFFLFPSKNKEGQDIAVAKREGAFSVKLGKREFKWRLPLGSLLPPKICPVDGEKLSGAWKFCPWHGVELK